MEQKIITPDGNYAALDKWISDNGIKRLMLVCGGSFRFLPGISEKIDIIRSGKTTVIRFSDFKPNPSYESVVAGVELFRKKKCDGIIAIGGGSAIDVAKCIKLFSNMESDGKYGEFLKTEIVPNEIPFLAMPTTAGTGSEATRYAVIYYEGKKQSVTSESCIPHSVLMDPGVLVTLPLYQKKATMMDAFCHAIESFWSVNSTSESKEYSKEAIGGILANMEGFLSNDEAGNAGMLMAAYVAGKAINITQTTAGHAMCYKITGLFYVSHGHAAALCNRALFPWMLDHTDRCNDPRGEEYLKKTFDELGRAMGCSCGRDGAEKLDNIIRKLEFFVPTANEEQFAELRTGVNPDRLKNNPVVLDENAINELYHTILNHSEMLK